MADWNEGGFLAPLRCGSHHGEGGALAPGGVGGGKDVFKVVVTGSRGVVKSSSRLVDASAEATSARTSASPRDKPTNPDLRPLVPTVLKMGPFTPMETKSMIMHTLVRALAR